MTVDILLTIGHCWLETCQPFVFWCVLTKTSSVVNCGRAMKDVRLNLLRCQLPTIRVKRQWLFFSSFYHQSTRRINWGSVYCCRYQIGKCMHPIHNSLIHLLQVRSVLQRQDRILFVACNWWDWKKASLTFIKTDKPICSPKHVRNMRNWFHHIRWRWWRWVGLIEEQNRSYAKKRLPAGAFPPTLRHKPRGNWEG